MIHFPENIATLRHWSINPDTNPDEKNSKLVNLQKP